MRHTRSSGPSRAGRSCKSRRTCSSLSRRARRPAGGEPRHLPSPTAPGRVLRLFRGAALTAISVIITAADSAAFAESYRGLWVWARHHGLSGFWAAAFPLQVDTFIIVGEPGATAEVRVLGSRAQHSVPDIQPGCSVTDRRDGLLKEADQSAEVASLRPILTQEARRLKGSGRLPASDEMRVDLKSEKVILERAAKSQRFSEYLLKKTAEERKEISS